MDSVFAELGFDYSMDARWGDRVDRDRNLSNMAVVAEGWTRPARRLLFRSIRIEKWAQMQTVEHWAGAEVRDLDISTAGWSRVKTEKVASAVFKLLKNVPNLRRLRLGGRPLHPFNPVDSASLQSTVFLPHLYDLQLDSVYSSQPIIFDLLATSNHGITRLCAHSFSEPTSPLPGRQSLDFRGNLRYLSTSGAFYQTMLDPTLVAHDGLGGLEELKLWNSTAVETIQREGGLIRTIAPTLRTLTIGSKKAAWLTDFPTPLSSLTRLEIAHNYEAIPLPFFRRLPPALASLHFTVDGDFHAGFALWTATPALLPQSLKSIGFSIIYNITTFTQLPRVDTLQTTCSDSTVDHLRQLTPGTLPFTTLKMRFSGFDRPSELNSVKAECQRLGLVFSWDRDR